MVVGHLSDLHTRPDSGVLGGMGEENVCAPSFLQPGGRFRSIGNAHSWASWLGPSGRRLLLAMDRTTQ